MPTTKRAAKGGEYGANGEWYEGGKFINTIPENAKKEGSVKAKPRKVEIAPYIWEVTDKQSIYRQIAGIYGKVINGVFVLRTDDRLQQTLEYYGRTLAEVETLIARYNAGERYL